MQAQLTKVNVIYATQTGTSYDLAKQFVLINNGKLLVNKFRDISGIQKWQSQQADCLWIFFISTTGQGDFPYSMRAMWKKMLMKSHPSLGWMKFTIYSFGDRSYGDNFCLAARKFRQRLIGLQAQQVVQIGLGDQQQANGYLQQYRDKWSPRVDSFLKNNNLFVDSSLTVKKGQKEGQSPKQIKFNCSDHVNMFDHEYQMRILDRQQICSNKDRRIFTVDIELMNYPTKIQLGDVLSIYPENNPEDVKQLVRFFNIQLNGLYYNLELPSKPQNQASLPLSLSYPTLFRSYLNISSTLNHSFFIQRPDLPNLSSYCQNQLLRQKLIQLETDYDQYHNYIKKYKRNVVEVLIDFDLKKLPVKQFVQRCGTIFPRKYSIAQVVQNDHKKIIKLLFKLVKDKINQNRVYQGLCSHDLALWTNIGQTKKGNVLKGQFQYQQKSKNNFIFITLGTGIAPFMQFFDLAKKSQKNWQMQVFFTNRFQNQTYFQPQLQELVSQNKLNPFLSFTGQGGKRIIRVVQDNCKDIEKMIQENGLDTIKIMICGPKQVCQGLQNILSRQLGLDIKLLKKKKVLIYQNW